MGLDSLIEYSALISTVGIVGSGGLVPKEMQGILPGSKGNRFGADIFYSFIHLVNVPLFYLRKRFLKPTQNRVCYSQYLIM